jgi:ribonuclease Z
MKRLFVLLGVLLVALGGVFAGYSAFKREIGEHMFQRAVAANVGRDQTAGLADGLHVFVCGSGSPMPDADRAGPCLGVLAGSRAFVFDVGSGSIRKLARMGFPVGRTERVFLTHLHSDHIDGMGELLLQAWVGAARTQPLPVSGPVGTSRVVAGFNEVYAIDSTYRIAHHGAGIVPASGFGGAGEEFVMPVGASSLSLVNEADLKITAFSVDHKPVAPAFGYRIDYKGRSIAISGDTVYSENLITSARGVDVLFHEALQPRMVETMAQSAQARGQKNLTKVLSDIKDYHASPEEAAKAAQASMAQELVLYHTVPPLPNRLLYPAFLGEAKKAFSGKIVIAEDGLMVSLPAGSKTVQRRNVL